MSAPTRVPSTRLSRNAEPTASRFGRKRDSQATRDGSRPPTAPTRWRCWKTVPVRSSSTYHHEDPSRQEGQSALMGLRATELEVRSAKRSPHSTRAQTAHRSSLLSLASGSDPLMPRGKALGGGLARRAAFLPDEPPTCLVCSAGVPHTVRPLPRHGSVPSDEHPVRTRGILPRAHEPIGAGNSGRRLSRSARCFVTSSISAMSTRRRMVGFFLLTTNGSLEQSDDNLSAALSRARILRVIDLDDIGAVS